MHARGNDLVPQASIAAAVDRLTEAHTLWRYCALSETFGEAEEVAAGILD